MGRPGVRQGRQRVSDGVVGRAGWAVGRELGPIALVRAGGRAACWQWPGRQGSKRISFRWRIGVLMHNSSITQRLDFNATTLLEKYEEEELRQPTVWELKIDDPVETTCVDKTLS